MIFIHLLVLKIEVITYWMELKIFLTSQNYTRKHSSDVKFLLNNTHHAEE